MPSTRRLPPFFRTVLYAFLGLIAGYLALVCFVLSCWVLQVATEFNIERLVDRYFGVNTASSILSFVLAPLFLLTGSIMGMRLARRHNRAIPPTESKSDVHPLD